MFKIFVFIKYVLFHAFLFSGMGAWLISALFLAEGKFANSLLVFVLGCVSIGVSWIFTAKNDKEAEVILGKGARVYRND